MPAPMEPVEYRFAPLMFPPEVIFPAAAIEVPAETAPVAEIVPATLKAFAAEVVPIPTFEPLTKTGELPTAEEEVNCGIVARGSRNCR